MTPFLPYLKTPLKESSKKRTIALSVLVTKFSILEKKIKKDVVANIHTIDLEALEYHRQIYMFRNQPKEKKIIRRKTKTDTLASTKTSKVIRAIKPPKQLAPSTQL